MNRFKKVLAVVLSLALVLVALPMMSNKAGTKAAETTFTITSPTNNKLEAAGYIDIEWEAATASEVKEYNLYINNEKIATTTGTYYEYYTTKVEKFETYVEAVYINGTTETTDVITFGVSKKGLGLATDMGANIDLLDLGCSWYYNWAENPSSGSQYADAQFVPMVWKETNANNFKNRVQSAINKGYKYILTFNEPDLQGQCDMPVNSVYNVWQGIDDIEGINVSSPVTAIWPQASSGWFQPFMKLVDNDDDYYPDFISIHCYPDNYAGYGMATWFLENVVDWAWEAYGLPIWVTEFSTVGEAVTSEASAEFWAEVMPGLDEREYVERYAGFCFNAGNDYYSKVGLWNYNTGELTEAGWEYKLHGNPEGFTPSRAQDTSTFTVTKGNNRQLLSDTKTINNVNCEDYVKSLGATATSNSEIGNGGLASLAIDDNLNSRWESKHKVDPCWLTVDLKEEVNIKEVDVIWENASASYYYIEVSNDGENWTPVADVTGNGGRCDVVTFKNQTSGRYVRIYGVSRSTDYGYSIYDLAIYGTTDEAVDATTEAPETESKDVEVRTTRPRATTEPPAPQRPTTVAPTTTNNGETSGESPTVVVEESTTSEDEYIASMNRPSKVTIKKINKKKLSAKKIVLAIKKVPGATGYTVAVYKSKKAAKNDGKAIITTDVTKIKMKLNSKKFANRKKLFVKVGAYVKLNSGTKVYGKWSKIKKIKIK